MVQRSVKRSAVRVRWEFSDTPYANLAGLFFFYTHDIDGDI